MMPGMYSHESAADGGEMTTLGNLIEGLQIIAKYVPTTHHCVDAEHDHLHAGPEGLEVSEADRKRLGALGWYLDVEFDSWAVFT